MDKMASLLDGICNLLPIKAESIENEKQINSGL